MIRMKAICAATAVFAFGLTASSFAATSNNTVRFMGEVSEQTCNITVNGSSSAPVILLPTAAKGQLASAGDTTGETPFTVMLSGCGAQTSNASVLFVANDVDGVNLKNIATTSPASNVAIQLMEGTTALDFVGNKAQTASQSVGGTNTSATYDLTARYFATGASTAGSVEAQVQFAVTYM